MDLFPLDVQERLPREGKNLAVSGHPHLRKKQEERAEDQRTENNKLLQYRIV